MLGHSKKSGYKSTLRYAAILNEDVVEALDLIDGPEEKEETKVVKFTKQTLAPSNFMIVR